MKKCVSVLLIVASVIVLIWANTGLEEYDKDGGVKTPKPPDGPGFIWEKKHQFCYAKENGNPYLVPGHFMLCAPKGIQRCYEYDCRPGGPQY